MIVLLLVLAVLAVVFFASRRFVLPSRELREWNRDARAIVQAQVDAGEADCFAFRYAWGGRPGDHDDKLVWRVHPVDGKLRTFVAPVDRRGRRTAPSRRVLIR